MDPQVEIVRAKLLLDDRREREDRGAPINPENEHRPCLWCAATIDSLDQLCNSCFVYCEQLSELEAK